MSDTLAPDQTRAHTQLQVMGHLARELAGSDTLVQGPEDVLRERLSFIDATMRSLAAARNRVAEQLGQPDGD